MRFNKGFWFMYSVYLVFLILDFWSTFRNGIEYASVMESNPVFSMFGWFGMVAVNLAYIVFFPWFYHRKKTNVWARYLLIVLMVVLCFARLIIVKNNLAVAEVVTTVEMAKVVATPIAKGVTTKFVAALLYGPLVLMFLPYLIFSGDHIIKRKDLEE